MDSIQHKRTCQGLGLMGTVLGILWTSSAVQAIPRPMSAEQLLKNSDVVAHVRVLGVTCTEVTLFPRGNQQLPVYHAWLQITKITKGKVKENQTIIVTWKEMPKGLIGGAPPVRYFPGEEVITHLKWNENTKIYNSTFYNGKGEAIKKPTTTNLPTKAGEFVLAGKEVEKKE